MTTSPVLPQVPALMVPRAGAQSLGLQTELAVCGQVSASHGWTGLSVVPMSIRW